MDGNKEFDTGKLIDIFKEVLLPISEYGNSVYIRNISSGPLSEQMRFVDEVVPKIGFDLEKSGRNSRATNKIMGNVKTIVHTANAFGLTPIIRLSESVTPVESGDSYETRIQVEVGTLYGITVFNVGKINAKKEEVIQNIKNKIKLYEPVKPPKWVKEVLKARSKDRQVVYIIE